MFLVPNDGPYGPKHVAFIDYIIKLFLCLPVIYAFINISQHTGMDSIRIFIESEARIIYYEKYYVTRIILSYKGNV
jgi:hypothetical protein